MKNNPNWEEVHRGMWVYKGPHEPYDRVATRQRVMEMIQKYAATEELRDMMLKPYLKEIEQEEALKLAGVRKVGRLEKLERFFKGVYKKIYDTFEIWFLISLLWLSYFLIKYCGFKPPKGRKFLF